MKESAVGKRAGRMLLAAVLAFSMSLPMYAYGVEPADAGSQDAGAAPAATGVAQVVSASGETVEYQTFGEAFAAAKDGDTVKLIADVDASGVAANSLTISSGENVVLDLAGHELKLANTTSSIRVFGTLTVSDSTDVAKSGTGQGKIWTDTVYTGGATGHALINAVNGGSVIMESGFVDTASFTSDNANQGQFAFGIDNISSDAFFTMNGGKIMSGWYAISGNGQNKTHNGIITINGGELISVADYAIYSPQKGSVTINGGTVYGATGGVCMNSGDLFINGGVVTSKGQGSTGDWGDGTGGVANAAVNVNAAYGAVSATITGGKITAEGDAIVLKANAKYETSVSVSGGTFNQALPAEFCAEGFAPRDNGDGTFGVESVAAAQVISASGAVSAYATLGEAFAAAKDGDTVKLIADATDAQSVVFAGRSLTVDLNGHSIGFALKQNFNLKQGGRLVLTGAGKVYEQSPYFGPVVLSGSADDQANYAVLEVGEGVTLEGWTGIFIDRPYGGGVVVNCDGDIVTVRDTDGYAGHGVYINGAIQKTDGNVAQITMGETSSITGVGNGIYAAGYAKWTLNGDIEGDDALSVKSGEIVINSGTYHAFGTYSDPITQNNGSENTGSAVSITSNDSYAKKLSVTINGGTFSSDHGYAFYEGIAQKNGVPAAAESFATIAINNGSFNGSADKGALLVATAKDKKVVSGGTFNSALAEELCTEGFSPVQNPDGSFGVEKVVVAEVNGVACSSLAEALAEATKSIMAGQPVAITLLDNVVSGADAKHINLPAGATVVLDLNGFELKGVNAGILLENHGDLTIKDTSAAGTGKMYTTDIAAQGRHAIVNYGTLLIESGTFGSSQSRGNALRNYGSATIDGGTFTACDNFTNGGYAYAIANGKQGEYPDAAMVINNATVSGKMNGALAADGGVLTVKGGEFTLGTGAEDNLFRLIYTSGDGKAVVEGGSFTRNVKNDYGFVGGDGASSVIIKNGTFADAVNEAITFDSGTVQVEGGTFNNGVKAPQAANVAISGGSFKQSVPEELCAEGFSPVQNPDGTFGVQELLPGQYVLDGFKGGKAQQDWTYPHQPGKAFAGWYEDAAFQTPCAETKTTGLAYAKFVDVEGVAGSEALMWFKGGSLRLDYGETYDKASLRLGYEVNLPEGAKIDWAQTGWNYTKGDTPAMNGPFVSIKNYAKSKAGADYVTNLVMTGIPAKAYSTQIRALMSAAYWTVDGTHVVAMQSVDSSRSVLDVAKAVVADPTAPAEQRAYAQELIKAEEDSHWTGYY